MRVLIVIETCFGNTERIAHAIAGGLCSRSVEVEIVQAPEALAHPQGFDLLLIGSPTHNMGLPTASTRHQARTKGAQPGSTGISEWLTTLPHLDGQRVATFATVTGGMFSGSAAKSIEKHLRKLAAAIVAREDFIVRGTEGPLSDGELERAWAWGASLT